MNIPGYGNTVVCPYDKAHVLMTSSFQIHLIKCARNHPEIKLEKCPFDVTHHLRPHEIAAHLETCPSRASFDQYRYIVVEGNAQQQPIEIELPPPVKSTSNANDESWDDVHVSTYDPQKYVQNAPLLRNLNCAPPAERKKFKDSERRRLAELERSARKN